MKVPPSLVTECDESRRRFLDLVANVRVELHRYCARMTGSVTDAEDIVQDTMARAYFALPEIETLPNLRAWLFRIAHNRALDHLRRYERKNSTPLDAVEETARDDAEHAEDALARQEAVRAALSRFVELPPGQRSCVALKDVLGHSEEEISDLLGMSVAAVKSALHRGRVRLRATASTTLGDDARPPSPTIARYAALFNARDWDGLRAMLSEDVRLDLVSRSQRVGPAVGEYFTRYGAASDWHLVPARLDGREVIAVFRHRDDERPAYFIELELRDDRVVFIRDFRYVPYIADEAQIVVSPKTSDR